MIDKIKHYLTVLDLPSGVVLGIHTVVMIGLSIAAYAQHRAIDTTIQTVYGIVLGAFAIHRTSTAVTTITTNSAQDTPNDTQR